MTDDATAIRRAADSMVRLDLLINKMKHDGTLRTFNATYKAKRAAAKAEGRGYMSYSRDRAAEARADPDASDRPTRSWNFQ